MVNKERWQDFALVETAQKPHKQHGRWLEDYAVLQCPYCLQSVELPASAVKNSKASKCSEHLMRCTGVAPDGRGAADDPRISTVRRASERCAAHMHLAKRGRTEEAILASDDTPRKEELLAKCTGLEGQNDRLVARNDALNGRVHALEEQMHEKNGQVDGMQRQLDELQRGMQSLLSECHLWKSEFRRAVGFGQPPEAERSVHACVEKVSRLRIAVGCLSVLDGADAQATATELRRRIKSRDEQIRVAERKLEAARRELRGAKEATQAGDALKRMVAESKCAGRHFKLGFHSDKQESDQMRQLSDRVWKYVVSPRG